MNGTSLNELDSLQRGLLEALEYEQLQNIHAQKEAVACVRYFAGIRDVLLQTYPWTFARRDETLVGLSEPLKGWRFSYALPTACVRPLQLISRRKTVAKWEEAGSVIGCEYRPVSLRYTARITDTTKWSPQFQEAFCLKLAVDIALSVNSDFAGTSSLLRREAGVISEAYRVGAIDEGGQIEEDLYKWDRYSNDLSHEYLGSGWRHEP